MTDIKLIYQSKSGHTYTVARALGSELNIEPIDINAPSVLGGTDLLFVGTGIYGGKPDQHLMDYLDQLPVNTIRGAAVFSTSSSGDDHTELIVNLLAHKGIEVYPKHLCLKGKKFFLRRKKPDVEDLQKARAFAREVVAAFEQ